MPKVQIRNVPEETYEKLKIRAKEDRRSLQQEAAWLLEFALNSSPVQRFPTLTVDERWARLDAMREDMRRRYGVLPDSTPDIRKWRDTR